MPKQLLRTHSAGILLLMVAIFTVILVSRVDATERFVDPNWVETTLIPGSLYQGFNAFSSISAALNAASPGYGILLNPGKYEEPKEHFPILVDKEVSISSLEGNAQVVISGSDQKSVFEIKADNVEISGLTIEFKRTGILVLTDEVKIFDNRLKLASQSYLQTSCGIWLAGARAAQISDNEFKDCGIAMAGPPISERSKDLPVLTGLFEVGESRDFFTTHKIEDNSVNGKPLYYLVNKSGINLEIDAGQIILACCSDIVLDGLNISGPSMGVEIAYCTRIKVNNSRVSNCGLFGIYLCYSDYCEISNTICSDDTHGIDIRASKLNRIINCEISDCGQGLFISWGSSNLAEKCVMKGNGVGVFVASGEANRISSCRIAQNEIGLNTKNENSLFLNENLISNNTTAGARLLNTSSSCFGSKFEENWVGMIAIDCPRITIFGCEFNTNANCGLYVFNIDGARISKRVY